jgi:cytochrome P450
VDTPFARRQKLPRLDDPDFYLGNPHATFARLRAEQSIFLCPSTDVIAVTRYADIRNVGAQPEAFSSASGVMLNDAKYGGDVTNSFFPEGAELVTTADPPRHDELREVIAPAFARNRIVAMEPEIRAVVRRLLDDIPTGVEVDFVEAVAAPLTDR